MKGWFLDYLYISSYYQSDIYQYTILMKNNDFPLYLKNSY